MSEVTDISSILSVLLSTVAVLTLAYHLAAQWAVYKERADNMYALYEKTPQMFADSAVQQERFKALVLKVDTVWEIIFARGKNEALSKGIITHQSPLRLAMEVLAKAPELEEEMLNWYKAEGKTLGTIDLAVQIREKFGPRLDTISRHLDLSPDATIVAAIFIMTGKLP